MQRNVPQVLDCGESDVIGSLAGLAEKLTRRKMDEEELRNPNLVVAVLKQGLEKREGRWLLCLDNADNSKLSGILNEVCGIVDETQVKGRDGRDFATRSTSYME